MTDPDDLVDCVVGSQFGVIDDAVAAAIGRQAGPICLPYGAPGARGFGLRHIESTGERVQLIQSQGFASVTAYLYFVCQAYNWVIRGKRDRLVLVRVSEPFHHTAVIQRRPDRDYWTIVTGLPKRVQRGDKLWERAQAGRSEPSPGVVEKRPRLETLTLPKKK